MDKTAIRVVVSGRVQGVWFRAWTKGEADGLGLDGWVRNRPDGSVEALFSGPVETVRTMIDRCRRGPPAARVDRLEEHAADAPAAPGFHVTR